MELNYKNLCSVLMLANGSERNESQLEAEKQLKLWEVEKGYHFFLQEIYINQDLPLQLRWLAIICFKNGVEKYWRSSKANAISKEEKDKIKTRLFQMVGEKNNQLAIQNAHSIARIVRFDFPMEWPNLFDELSHYLEESVFHKGDMTATNNLLIILNQIIKTVSVVRVGRSRHAMQSKAPVITPVLIKLYIRFFQQWTSITLDLGIMEVCYLCLKNLRRIITNGFEQPHKNPDVVEFLNISIQHLKSLVIEHEKYSSSDMLERYVTCYSKLYVELINTNPTSFVLLPCSIEIISTFMSLLEQKAETIYENSEENSFWETLALKSFMILKKVIAFVYKKGAVVLKMRNDRDEVNTAINKLTTEIFTTNVVQRLCDLIIDWYLRLKPSDLESWQLEPEEWCNEELSSSWEYQIRPCAENFFQDLICFFKEDLSQFIINKISNGLNNQQQNPETILLKDSILCTFQLSAVSIADLINFDTILEQILIPEAMKNDISETKIIKRRVCLIISEWVSVKCSRESRVAIFELLRNLLQKDSNNTNDIIVRLTAIQTLKIVIDDWDFNKYDFQPFLKDFVQLALLLLNEIEFTESKLYIVNVLAILIYRCNPLVDHTTLIEILQVVPKFWETVSNQNDSILKNSLLRVLKNLVVSLNAKSVETYQISLPLIKSACTGDSENYSLLSEDGYELWLAVIQYCPTEVEVSKKEELMNMFTLIPYGLLNSTEILATILAIIRSYALFTPHLFEGEIGEGIFRTLAGYLPSMRDDAFTVFIPLMDILLLQIGKNEAFFNNLISSGLLNAMILFVLDDSHEIISENKIYLLFSRIAGISSEWFFKMLDFLSINEEKFFTTWIDNVNNNGNPKNKKINLIALFSLAISCIPQKNQFFISKLGEILKKLLIFLEEVNEDESGSCNAYNQDIIYEDIDDYCYGDSDIAPHGEKKRYQVLIQHNDPVFCTNLRSYIKQGLNNLRSNLGDNTFNQIIAMNDEYTIEKLNSILN